MARVFELGTPLGEDVLLFRAMTGVETLGRLSEFSLSALSERPTISSADLLGKDITVAMELRNGGYRYFNGYVTRFTPDGVVGRFYHYRFTARPWLWYLTRTADCRIYQDKTVPEILTAVFTKPEHEAIASYDASDLTGTYARREYCVQYRETDFNFVSRLMEEEGIYYYFEHSNGQHVMKLVDSQSGHRPLEGKSTIAYYPPGTTGRVNEEYINAWTATQSIKPGVVALDDYDFTKPKAELGVRAKRIEPHTNAEYEVFDYPGEYSESPDGEHYAGARVDELHTDFDRAEARCDVRAIAVGRVFNLTNAPRPDQEREYLIIGARWELMDNAYESAPSDVTSYYCSFTALWSQQQFRPERLTPVPRVGGPQTAVVVGPPNEEIWCDKYGRVKVQFHWDRYGKRDENSSWWIRVAQRWAGAGWGSIYLPRIGQEVLVEFLEGDPDRPIIVGSVYNADEMPPYKLPDWKTMSTYKSRSTPHGAPKDFNEIRYEDKYGKEQVFIHCQKRMDVRVKQNKYQTIGGACNTGVGGDCALSVYGKLHLYAKGNLYERAEDEMHITAGGAVKIVAEDTYQLSSDASIEVNAADHITIESTTEVTLKVGGNFVKVDMTGVTIQGTIVNINSGGAAMPVSEFEALHPLYADEADNGEPGWVDRPKTGGGWWGQRSSKGGHHHAPVLPPLPPPPARRTYTTAPTLAQIQSDPFVDQALKQAFQDSNPNAPDVPRGSPGSLKHEQGGWVVWNKDTGQLEVVRVPPGTRDGLGPIVGTRPADNDHQQVVGWFHTHPNKSSEGYGSDPSPGDTGFQNSEARVPGIIETHDGRKTIPFP